MKKIAEHPLKNKEQPIDQRINCSILSIEGCRKNIIQKPDESLVCSSVFGEKQKVGSLVLSDYETIHKNKNMLT